MLVKLTEKAAAAEEVAGVEINLNCPCQVSSTSPKQYWRDMGWVAEMTGRIRTDVGNKLLIIKSPTTICDLEEIGAVIKNHGADAFTTFGGLVDSANLTHPDFMKKLIRDLNTRLDELRVKNLDEIRGCAKPH